MKHYVCRNCGYNIVGYLPDNCPFCLASKNQFITAEECTKQYEIIITKVNQKVTRLNSTPRLGIEHAAYQIETNQGTVMIDCPSTFRDEINPFNIILFTHHHFLGASVLYQKHFKAEVWIHSEDSDNILTINYKFDKLFNSNFSYAEIEAFHINGHTPGFTFYIFEDVLLICDYFVGTTGNFRLNPYGPAQDTLQGAREMKSVIENYNLKYVCGVNYVIPFREWKNNFERLLTPMGP
ncbi:MAG: rubredoxin-like domain-containing protein [Candidatus Thorarchaeota archaeon]